MQRRNTAAEAVHELGNELANEMQQTLMMQRTDTQRRPSLADNINPKDPSFVRVRGFVRGGDSSSSPELYGSPGGPPLPDMEAFRTRPK